MFLFLDPGQVLRLNVCALVLLAGAGFCIGGWLCAAVAAVAASSLPNLLVRFYRAAGPRFEEH